MKRTNNEQYFDLEERLPYTSHMPLQQVRQVHVVQTPYTKSRICANAISTKI